MADSKYYLVTFNHYRLNHLSYISFKASTEYVNSLGESSLLTYVLTQLKNCSSDTKVSTKL